MIAIDTNVLVRFLTGDDPEQFQASAGLFETQQIFVPDTVILETAWVLRWAYKFDPLQIIDALRRLFGLPNIHLRDPMTIALAVEWHEKGLDFADALHLAQSHHCQELMTFDQNFIKRAASLAACSVKHP